VQICMKNFENFLQPIHPSPPPPKKTGLAPLVGIAIEEYEYALTDKH